MKTSNPIATNQLQGRLRASLVIARVVFDRRLSYLVATSQRYPHPVENNRLDQSLTPQHHDIPSGGFIADHRQTPTVLGKHGDLQCDSRQRSTRPTDAEIAAAYPAQTPPSQNANRYRLSGGRSDW
jgi:hypothetical protein